MRRIVVAFALALCFFLPAGRNSTFRAVFRPVRFRQIVAAAENAFLSVCPVEQGGAQASVQRQDGGAEPTAHQRICDALRADTFLTIVQEQTVPTGDFLSWHGDQKSICQPTPVLDRRLLRTGGYRPDSCYPILPGSGQIERCCRDQIGRRTKKSLHPHVSRKQALRFKRLARRSTPFSVVLLLPGFLFCTWDSTAEISPGRYQNTP